GDGLDRGRADLRHPRARPLPGQRRVQSRLHAGAGTGAVLCRVPDVAQSADRPGLSQARSARGAAMTATTIDAAAVDTAARKPRSLWDDAWRRLRRNRMAVGAAAFLVVITLLAFGARWIPGLP